MQTSIRSMLCVLFVAVSMSGCRSRSEADNDSNLYEQGAGTKWFEPRSYQEIQRLLAESILKQDIKVGGSIFQTTLVDVLGIGADYRAAVSQLQPNNYQRIDMLRLKGSINAGSLLTGATEKMNLPIFMTIDGSKDIEFRRSFSTWKEASEARLMSPLDLPLTAQKAREWPTGNIVSIPTRIGLHLGVAQSTGAGSAVGARISGGVFWAGDCRIVISKLDADHVRVKIAASKSRGLFLEASVGANLNMFGYDPTGLINIDKQVGKALGLDFFHNDQRLIQRLEGLSFDYVVRLDGQWGDRAYESLITESWQLRPDELRNIRTDITHLKDLGFVDLTLAESLGEYDLQFPAEQRRIQRTFRGERIASGRTASGHVGLRPARYSGRMSLTGNLLTSVDETGKPTQYEYQLFTDGHKISSPFAQLVKPNQFSAAAMFSNDAPAVIVKDLAITWDMTFRAPQDQDFRDVNAKFASIFGDIPNYATFLQNPAVKHQILRVRAMVTITDHFWDYVTSFSEESPTSFRAILKQVRARVSPRFAGRYGSRSPAPSISLENAFKTALRRYVENSRQTWRSVTNLRIEGIDHSTGDDLIDILSASNTANVRETTYLLLSLMSFDESAQEVVPAFLLELARDLKIKDTYESIEFQSGNNDPVGHNRGENPNEALQNLVAEIFLETSGGSLVLR
jgi:hypothetical protein